jgi:hypothetical protein
MNERILDLARQVWPDPTISHINHMKFAELIIQECIAAVDNMPLHCAYTTFQESIVDCAKQQAINEIQKLFKE